MQNKYNTYAKLMTIKTVSFVTEKTLELFSITRLIELVRTFGCKLNYRWTYLSSASKFIDSTLPTMQPAQMYWMETSLQPPSLSEQGNKLWSVFQSLPPIFCGVGAISLAWTLHFCTPMVVRGLSVQTTGADEFGLAASRKTLFYWGLVGFLLRWSGQWHPLFCNTVRLHRWPPGFLAIKSNTRC